MAEGPRGTPSLPNRNTPICAIGASAGGVTALQKFFRLLPEDLGLAYVVILHLSPDQPSVLSEVLSACTKMPVRQVADQATLSPNSVFVIAPDRELVIYGDAITARPFTQPRGSRAPIDIFFRSIAAGRGDGMAVVLTGAGSDGALGVRAIKEAGGVVFVQDPAEAGFAQMPQGAIATGNADFVAPLARLVERIVEVARSKEAVRSLDFDEAGNELRRIVAFLRARTGHDFSSYKRATVMRRVMRRLQVCRLQTLAEYAEFLRTTPEEAQELFSDLLISVTMFFRDPAAFEALKRRAVRALFEEVPDEGIRVWVVGCATGEEAYTIAMLLLEVAAEQKVQPRVLIFATDLDETSLAAAREGRYPRSIEADVTEDRLRRFFVDEGTHYRIRKEVRDAVLFASHSVLKDPPFMRLDLIACRNLLIYLERALQQQLCSVFHYGLKPHRFLFLGSAEAVDAVPDLFAVVDKDARLYQSRPQASHTLPVLPQLFSDPRAALAGQVGRGGRGGRDVVPSEAHVVALERTAPPSILVDSTHDILHLSPSAGRFVLHSGGPFARRLPAVVRPELRVDLKLALDRAFERQAPTVIRPIATRFGDEFRAVALQVVPVVTRDRPVGQAVVFFLDGGHMEPPEPPEFDGELRPDEFRRLHVELRMAQEALIQSRQDHESSVQELRAANEELQSVNEEYRSTSEELETSKEELQSINEELQTVNAELKSKLQSISAAHSDLRNLTAATEIGTLFLDTDLRIKMFTPPIADLFNVTEQDVGRAITDFTHHLQYEGIENDVRGVMHDLVPRECEVRSSSGRWLMLRVRPYRTVDNLIQGTVATFVDITARVQAEHDLAQSERRLRALVKASSQALYLMSPDWTEMRELSGGGLLADTRQPSRDWLEHYVHPDDQAHVKAAIDEAIRTRSVFELEHRVRRIDGSIGWTLSRAVPIVDDKDDIVEWFGAAVDVSEAKRAAEQNETLLAELQHRVRNVLAVVVSIVGRTGAPGGTVEEYRERLLGRLSSLGRTQTLLTRSLVGVDLRTLVHDELVAQADEKQISLSGPPVVLAPNATEVLTLALHELATNAVKYGALSVPRGKVHVTWSTHDEQERPWVRLEWSESGVNGVAPPARKGFGTDLVTRRVPYELLGRVNMDFAKGGVRCVIEFPLEGSPSVLQTDAPAVQRRATKGQS